MSLYFLIESFPSYLPTHLKIRTSFLNNGMTLLLITYFDF